MKSEIPKKGDVLTIKRGAGTGISESETWEGYETVKELYDSGAEIKIMPDSVKGNVKFYFGYESETGRKYKRDIVVTRKQVKEIVKHLIELGF